MTEPSAIRPTERTVDAHATSQTRNTRVKGAAFEAELASAAEPAAFLPAPPGTTRDPATGRLSTPQGSRVNPPVGDVQIVQGRLQQYTATAGWVPTDAGTPAAPQFKPAPPGTERDPMTGRLTMNGQRVLPPVGDLQIVAGRLQMYTGLASQPWVPA